MFLNVILTILTVVLITITVLLTKWWRKYGREMFKAISSVKNITSQTSTINDTFKNPNINDLMDRMKKMSDMLGNFKK